VFAISISLDLIPSSWHFIASKYFLLLLICILFAFPSQNRHCSQQ
jgi:hypothetical protein